MKLRSGTTLWPAITPGPVRERPALRGRESCDIAVVGGGITGALMAHRLAESGLDVAVLEKRTVGAGSTAASTALLLYQTDTALRDLVRSYGERKAFRIYQLGRAAVTEIGELSRRLGIPCDFIAKPSLYLASDAAGEKALRAELRAQERAGFHPETISADRLRNDFGLQARGALFTRGSAQINPYRLTRGLFAHHERRGKVRIFEHTTVTGLRRLSGRTEVKTETGGILRAAKVVLCPGYEVPVFPRSGLVRLWTSYVIASAPMKPHPLWPENCLIWETARPYLYLRTTADGRVLVGGEDEPLCDSPPGARERRAKWTRLERRFRGFFPALEFKTEFSWSGVFGETPDGLPYVGARPRSPHLYYVLAYGGNGITFAHIGAGIVRDLCLHRKNPDAVLFDWARLARCPKPLL